MKKGISLIVLVITIIVMIILAASVVLSLSNSGIINKANDAVNKTNLKEVEQLATLIWSEEYMEGKRGDTLKIAVLEKLNDYTGNFNIDVSDTGVTVTEKENNTTGDNTIGDNTTGDNTTGDNTTGDNTTGDDDGEKLGDINADGGWTFQKTVKYDVANSATVSKGTQVLDIGTTVNYRPNGINGYTGGWKILGVDDKGRLLIMSATSVLNEDYRISGKQGFTNYDTILNGLVANYKDDNYGIAVRAPIASDIDNVTGYDIEKMKKALSSTDEYYSWYDTEVTYSWNGTDNRPNFTYTHDGKVYNSQLTKQHSKGFTYFDEATETWKTSSYISGTAAEIATIKCSYYYYMGNSNLSTAIPAYTFLFDSGNYWLATRCVLTNYNTLDYGLKAVCAKANWIASVYTANGDDGVTSLGVRAVVTLAGNVNLKESTINPGTYDLYFEQ